MKEFRRWEGDKNEVGEVESGCKWNKKLLEHMGSCVYFGS